MLNLDDCREFSSFFVGRELGKMGDKMGDKMGGGERRLLPTAFLPVFPFILDIFVRLRRSFLSSTRLFIHAMWVIPGYDFMDGDFNINFHSKHFIVSVRSTIGVIRFIYVHATDSLRWVRLYLLAG